MVSQEDLTSRRDSGVGPARVRGQEHWRHSKFSVQMVRSKIVGWILGSSQPWVGYALYW